MGAGGGGGGVVGKADLTQARLRERESIQSQNHWGILPFVSLPTSSVRGPVFWGWGGGDSKAELTQARLREREREERERVFSHKITGVLPFVSLPTHPRYAVQFSTQATNPPTPRALS